MLRNPFQKNPQKTKSSKCITSCDCATTSDMLQKQIICFLVFFQVYATETIAVMLT